MRCAVVTGSSRGIGLAIAKRFSAEGFGVVMNCKKDFETLGREAGELENAAAFVGDVGEYEQARRLIAFAVENFGGVDVLVNNAGSEWFGLFQNMRHEEWEDVTRGNLFTAMNCAHAVIPVMLARGGGVIVNVSSVWGERGASCEAAYSAAKAGVNAFTKSLAQELGTAGIRVNAVAPGAIDTAMNARLTKEEREKWTAGLALPRLGTAEEVAELVWFLSVSGSYITGQVVTIDGGRA